MIGALTLITQGLLFACAMFIAFRIFMLGFRYGVDVLVNVSLDEQLGENTQSAVRHEYIKDRRALAVARRDPYQDWRRKHKLPDTPVTRELYDDKDYRTALEAQEGANGNHS